MTFTAFVSGPADPVAAPVKIHIDDVSNGLCSLGTFTRMRRDRPAESLPRRTLHRSPARTSPPKSTTGPARPAPTSAPHANPDPGQSDARQPDPGQSNAGQSDPGQRRILRVHRLHVHREGQGRQHHFAIQLVCELRQCRPDRRQSPDSIDHHAAAEGADHRHRRGTARRLKLLRTKYSRMSTCRRRKISAPRLKATRHRATRRKVIPRRGIRRRATTRTRSLPTTRRARPRRVPAYRATAIASAVKQALSVGHRKHRPGRHRYRAAPDRTRSASPIRFFHCDNSAGTCTCQRENLPVRNISDRNGTRARRERRPTR